MKQLFFTIALFFSKPVWARNEWMDAREMAENSWRNEGGGSGGLGIYFIIAFILAVIWEHYSDKRNDE